VISIPSQNHGESFTECCLQNHTDFAGILVLQEQPTVCVTGFASSHLLDIDILSDLIYVPYSGTSLGYQIVLHSSDPKMTDQDPFFIASFLEACVLFDPGGDVATLPTCNIKTVGVQTANDHLLVSQDSKTALDAEIFLVLSILLQRWNNNL
jgi:hypothetical protein